MAERTTDLAHEGFHALADAERLLLAASDPARAREAARAALRALLLDWGQAPRGSSVGDLLRQAAETDDTLAGFAGTAEDLEADPPRGDPAANAKVFVDAARGRLANI